MTAEGGGEEERRANERFRRMNERQVLCLSVESVARREGGENDMKKYNNRGARHRVCEGRLGWRQLEHLNGHTG